jgi:hypothetical protein
MYINLCIYANFLHILSYKTNFKKFQKAEIKHSMFSIFNKTKIDRKFITRRPAYLKHQEIINL